MIHRCAVISLVALVVAGCAVKPQPLTQDEIAAFSADRLARVTANQEPLRGKVDLYEAMARAIKYNLDARVEATEASLRLAEADYGQYDMLPKLVAGSGYLGRNNVGGTENDRDDRDTYTADLQLSWNILDFGLSYYRAKQLADKALIQEETKRKVVNRLIEDVRTAYWRAASYQRLVGRMKTLEGRVQRALADTRHLAASAETSPTTALAYERELIQIKRELGTLEGELLVAKAQLASLMNVPPETDYQVEVPDKAKIAEIDEHDSVQHLYQIALQNRPEMREVAYELRINSNEATAAQLELLPGINLFGGVDYDSTSSLLSNNWISWGAKASWNLMKFAEYPAHEKVISQQDASLDMKSLSVAMAVMTQVHVSRARFFQLERQYSTASELSNVQRRLLNSVRTEVSEDRSSEQTLIREEMNTLLADAKLDTVYADVQNAYANVYSALGLDPFPGNLNTNDSVAVVASSLRQMWLERGQGRSLAVASN